MIHCLHDKIKEKEGEIIMGIRSFIVNLIFKKKIKELESDRMESVNELKTMGVTFVSDDEKLQGSSRTSLR